MLTAGLSDSQPVPPPAADALLIIVQRQQAVVEEFWGKREPGKVFRDVFPENSSLAWDKRGNWASVLQDKHLMPGLGFTSVLKLSSSRLTCAFPHSRPGALALSSHCNKMQMTELIPPLHLPSLSPLLSPSLSLQMAKYLKGSVCFFYGMRTLVVLTQSGGMELPLCKLPSWLKPTRWEDSIRASKVDIPL